MQAFIHSILGTEDHEFSIDTIFFRHCVLAHTINSYLITDRTLVKDSVQIATICYFLSINRCNNVT